MRFNKGSSFCLWVFNYSSTICWKGELSSIELLLHLCQKSLAYIHGSSSRVSILFRRSMCLSLHQHLSLDYCSYISLKLSRVNPPTIFFFFKIASSIPVPCLSIQILRECFLYLQKCLAGTLIGIASNLYFSLERTDIFTMLSLPIYGHAVTVCLSISSLVSFMSIFCSFQHTSTIHAFLHLYLVFNFWVIISSTIILVSMSVCSWIVYRNAIGIFYADFVSWASLVVQTVKSLPAMWEAQFRSLGQEYTLEKEVPIHSSILAWRISWTQVSVGLQSMGSQRVEHDWATFTFTFVSWDLDKVTY